jgi:regulator of protease activity HflC (stomatin/prohibitin superfamily)
MNNKSIFGVVSFLLLIVAFLFWFFPTYGVWQAGLSGKAALMRAEQEKQIQIEQAKAELESAKLRAEAIAIVGEASQKYPEYRTQEFIGAFGEAIKSGAIDQIIYVPTEANIPIVNVAR